VDLQVQASLTAKKLGIPAILGILRACNDFFFIILARENRRRKEIEIELSAVVGLIVVQLDSCIIWVDFLEQSTERVCCDVSQVIPLN